jgi:amino acid transporter
MKLGDVLFGRPLRTSDERAEQIGPLQGIPIFGLDALSSAGYGPEAALTILIPLGTVGVHYVVPITTAILVLLAVVFVSYLQTIPAYPHGGGSYTVARENLGENAGLLAASALLIDYVLTVAVGIAAGVGALVSAVPSLQPHTLTLCLAILVLITFVNLRGVSEAGTVFMIPTYLFVGSLFAVIVIGLFKTALAGGSPAPVVPPHPVGADLENPNAWLLLQAFASGCTAMTGVEAVSNGVRAFREPTVKNARKTLSIIIAILMVLLAGIALLARAYGVGATDPGAPGYESVLSQLLAAVAGKGVFYYVAMTSILLVLALSANTAFADFPRLCHAISRDGYLPVVFGTRGRRLVYSNGVLALMVVAGALLAAFDGVTDRLIPLYAVGAFLAFTMSQAGMVLHWRRVGGAHAGRSMLLNGLGAAATFVTVIVVLVAKFVEGAWITALLIPGLFLLMKSIRAHYDRVRRELESEGPLLLTSVERPIVVVPIQSWNKHAKKALRFAFELSSEVQAIHISTDEPEEDIRKAWRVNVDQPAKKAGLPCPTLKIVSSPYRHVVGPIVDHVVALSKEQPKRQIAVVVPWVVEDSWHNYLLHTQRAAVLRARLFMEGNPCIVVADLPWYLGRENLVR